MKRIIVAVTGASGFIYADNLLRHLAGKTGCMVDLIISEAGKQVMIHEGFGMPDKPEKIDFSFICSEYGFSEGRLRLLDNGDFNVDIASGSSEAEAMVVVPCTMNTLAGISAGFADNLIKRSADVMLKEKRTLVIVPRETPLSITHLENMLRLAKAGCVVLPAMPGFYHGPSGTEGVADFISGKIFSMLGMGNIINGPWKERE